MDNIQIFPNWRRTASAFILSLLTCSTSFQAASAGARQPDSSGDTVLAFGRVYELPERPELDSTFTLTAYNLDKVSTGKSPGDPGYGVTSTGAKAATGRTVAVDPAVIPYGSLLYIEGIGWRLAEDTGGAIRGHHIDVLVDSRGTALKFGVKRNQRVEVFAPPQNEASVKAIKLPS